MLVKLVHFYIIEPQRPTEGLIFLWGWGVEDDIEHCHFVSNFLPNLQLNTGKNYLKTAIIIDESLILAIVSRNYSTKPNYIFKLKHELKVWKTGIRSFDLCLCLFLLFMNIRPILCLVFGCFVYYLCVIINI